MVFNRKNWTFARLIKAEDNPGTKIFHKLARSVEKSFKSNELVTDNPVRMSDLNASMNSLNSPLKTSSVKSFKIEKSVRFDMEPKDYQTKQVDQYLEICKVKIYVTPRVESVATVEIHNKQNQQYSCEENNFNDDDDCFKSLTSLQDLSSSSTYLTTEDVSGINESLGNIIKEEEKASDQVFEEDAVENEDLNRSLIQEETPEGIGVHQNLVDVVEDEIEIDWLKVSELLFGPYSSGTDKNDETEDGIKDNSLENEHEVVVSVVVKELQAENTLEENVDAAAEIEQLPPLQGPEDVETNFHEVQIDLMNSSEALDVNLLHPNEEFGVTDMEAVVKKSPSPVLDWTTPVDVPEEFNNQPKSSDIEDSSANEKQKIDDGHAEEKYVFQPKLKSINVDEDKPKIKERGSLVKNMIKFFNKNLPENPPGQLTHRDVLSEISEYPLDMVRQRIDQFSKEYAETDAVGYNSKNKGEVSHSLVQQRTQQLLAEANLEKIFTFRPSEFATTTQAKDPQIKNATEKSVQTQTCQTGSDFRRTSSNSTFIRDLQLLLNLHQTNSDTDDDSQSLQFSDSLEISGHHETESSPNFLRRSFALEDLSHLEDYNNRNLEVHGDADGEKTYSRFAGYTREQSSPPNAATPNHYEVIQESDYLTPVDVAKNMSEEDGAARRNEEISKKFVTNLYESGQRSCVSPKKPADYKIIHSENELHIRDVEVIEDKKRVNYGNVNRRSSSESDSGMSRRVDSVNVGGNNCIDVVVPTEFCQEELSLEDSDTEADRKIDLQANGGAEMEEDIYASVDDGEKGSKSDDEIYFALKDGADVQGIIMQQASKALELCRSSRSFPAGKELVEAERILLVSTYKYDLLRNEIQKAKYDTFRPRTDHALGNITVDNIFLPLQLNEEDFTRYNHYFILVLSHQDKVFSTKVVEGNPMNYANFDDVFTFQDLPSDFTVTVDIYGLKVKKSEDKKRLSKKFKTRNKLESLCPRKRVFYKDVQTVTLMETSVAQSSFALHGSVTIALEDVNNHNWPIKNPSNTVTSKMNLSVSVDDVRIGGRKKGFLTVGSEVNGHLAWNRRWCVLDGPIMKFFNYPSDEDLVEPAVTLDFRHCFSGEIEVCDRERCAKSRTMLLKTKSVVDGASESVGHFLSADSRKDLLEWQSKINSTVEALAKWNQLSCDGN